MSSLGLLFLMAWSYFLLLYFGGGAIFERVCLYLYRKGLVNQIVKAQVSEMQIAKEKRNSLLSTFIFGLSVLPVIALLRSGHIEVLDNTLVNVLVGLMVLSIWNEVHFFLVHRLLHTPFLMRHIHKVHHQSVIPTVYSVFSFHWIEALLLSTVPLCIIPFVAFAPLAIVLYPVASILLNFAGHCNYRFGSGKSKSSMKFSTHHNEHHHHFSKSYGFASQFLDKLFSKQKK